jgi:hypothetical protein
MEVDVPDHTIDEGLYSRQMFVFKDTSITLPTSNYNFFGRFETIER